MVRNSSKIEKLLKQADKLFLFLDYDGTLADFAPNPDIVNPDPKVIELLRLLIANKHIQTAIISGRTLSHLQKLVPLQGITLAGTYGLEIQMYNGEIIIPLDYADIRPQMDILKVEWRNIIQGESDLYLEDKKWTLALHAKHAEERKAEMILTAAMNKASELLDKKIFQLLPGHKFLEASPIQANKGNCVTYLINKYPLSNELLLYMGDDDKDEEAFAVIQSKGGFAVRVCSNVINNPIEDWRLDDPQAARDWLRSLIGLFS